MSCGFEKILSILLTHFILTVGTVIRGNVSTAGFLLSGALNESDFTKSEDAEPEKKVQCVIQ
jgi:hypothetical protein